MGGLLVAVANSKCAVDFFCVKNNPNKKQKPKQIAGPLRVNNSYINKSSHVIHQA